MKPVLQLFAGLFLIAGGTGNAFVMNNGRSTTHVSFKPFTFLPTNIKKKNSIKSTLKSISKNEEEVSPVNQSFREMADSLVLNKDAKQTNLELVSRGQSFDSYRRRFDYFPNSLSTNDGQSKSVWVRDNTKNSNLIAYLVASRGLSVEDATEEAEKASRHSFKRVKKSGTQAFRASYTDFDFIISAKSSQEDKIVEYAWDGDKYVTTIFLEVNGERKLIEKIERKLDFDANTLNKGDDVIMMVKSTYYGETEILTCEETFCRAFDGKQVKVSEVERVPACIANVNVQTVLLPKGNGEYDIFLDGEADALLSRGLLAVLSATLSSSSINAEVVLDIDSFRVADKLRLRSILSTGRNDGLGSILTVVQRQITELLGGKTIHDKKEHFDGKEKKSEVRKPTVAMLLSGGVDSAVALSLLLEQGYDVTAFYLKIWLEDELAHLGECPWEEDFNTCVEVCKHAGGVKLEAISLQEQYKNRVISYAIDEAKRGRTPNPDIMCNSRVKFGCFYDAIEEREFDYVASGHYAQLEETGSSMRLLRAPDPVKDQSYFLAALTQKQLRRVIFPIGEFHKFEVRELAEKFDLPNKDRPDSQGLCFLGKVKFDDFIRAYLGDQPGDIVDAESGDIIGEHSGVWFHTVGQRKGLGLFLHPKATAKGPWYVVAKDPKNSLIIVSNRYDDDTFESTRSEFYVEDVKWITTSPPIHATDETHTIRLSMKIRHGPNIVNGSLEMRRDISLKKDSPIIAKILLDAKDGGLAPGQFVAFYTYNGTECLGSGVISEKHWTKFLSTRTDQIEST